MPISSNSKSSSFRRRTASSIRPVSKASASSVMLVPPPPSPTPSITPPACACANCRSGSRSSWPDAGSRTCCALRLARHSGCLKIANEEAVLRRLVVTIPNAEQIGRMNGGDHPATIGHLNSFAADLADSHRLAHQTTHRGGSECDHDLRLEDGALKVEPPAAALDLVRVRLLVQPPFAARREFEMLDRVGDEDLFAVDAGLRDRLAEHAPGGADEGRAGDIFFVTGLLADQHDTRLGRAFARHDLRRVSIEWATRALGLFGAQGF